MIRKNQEKIGRGTNLLKICMFLVAVLFFVGQVNAEIGMWCEGPNEDDVKVCKSVDPNVIRPPDGTAKITLNVSWPVEKKATPADIVFAIDSSESTIRAPVTLAEIKNKTKKFIDKMDPKYHRAAVVSWDDEDPPAPDFIQGLTTNFTLVKQKIDEAKSEEHELTYFSVGLRGSIKALDESPNPDPKARRIIVFLTDAKEEYKPHSTELLEKARNKGYKIYSIGPLPNDDLKTMARETGVKPHDIEELEEAYVEITKVDLFSITKIKDITVTDALHSYLKVKDNFTIPPTTGPSRNPDGTTTMVWRVKEEDAREVKKGDEEKKVWETSFDINPDFNNLPIDVSEIYRALTHGTDDISIVNYTILGEPEHKSLDIPSGNILISCPTIPPSPSPGDFAILVPTSISLSPPTPAEGQKTTIIATIQNIGRKNSGSFAVRFIADGNLIGEEHVERGLESGEATTVETDWTAKKGVDITAKVDITSTSGSTQTPVKKPTPGFGTIFAIAALLAVAYLVWRRRKA